MSRHGVSVFLVLVSLFALSQQAKPTKWKCDAEDVKAADIIVAKIMTYGRADRVYPTSKAELKSYCK